MIKETTKTERANYHDRPEWSYSQMKVILDSGIDYAVAAKMGMLPKPASKAIDIGSMVHQVVLGGEESYVISPYDNFRTKEAQEWKKEQTEAGKIILTATEELMIKDIAKNIIEHPHSKKYLSGEKVQHEVEMYATLEGVPMRGKADAIRFYEGNDKITILDLKTTAKFDDFKWKNMRSHYDLQAATYSVIAAATQGKNLLSDMDFVEYIFCVAETVAPYRVQYAVATKEYIEHGLDKLNRCVSEIKEFEKREDKTPNFQLTEWLELGDFS